MSEVKDRVLEAVKAAMRAGEKQRLGTLRMVSAAIKQQEVDTRRDLSDEDVLAVLGRMIKQRREALDQYERAGREDLAGREREEIGVISEFLPEPLSDDEIDALIEEAIAEAGARSVKDMGRVMASLKPRLHGRADMGAVSARVKTRLSS